MRGFLCILLIFTVIFGAYGAISDDLVTYVDPLATVTTYNRVASLFNPWEERELPSGSEYVREYGLLEGTVLFIASLIEYGSPFPISLGANAVRMVVLLVKSLNPVNWIERKIQ